MEKKLLIISFVVSLIHAQNVNINCNFVIIQNRYTCQIFGVTVSDNQNANYVIGGQHLFGRTNADVQRVQIVSSNIPFVVNQFFSTFPNIADFIVTNGGLTRIQSGAFNNARSLAMIDISGNTQLRAFHANAFSGALHVQVIDILGNNLENIHETSFDGLNFLSLLFLEHNSIQNLPTNIFRTLSSLQSLSLNNNWLRKLDGNLLANNSNIMQLEIANNFISSIGRNFLNSLNRLAVFNTVNNQCVSELWRTGGDITINTIRAGLEPCFDDEVENPEPPTGEIRRFVLEMRGPLKLYFMNGTEIVQV
jgi:hypothetical protein